MEKVEEFAVEIGWRAKQELIRAIQEKQGKDPCFQTGKKYCGQRDCRWRIACNPGGLQA